MRRFLALLLTGVLFVNAAFAGLNRNKSRYVGGTARDIPVPSVGILETTDQTHLTFNYEPGKAVDKSKFAAGNFSLPYPEITAIGYGQHASLRFGQTLRWPSSPEWAVFSFCFRKAKATVCRSR